MKKILLTLSLTLSFSPPAAHAETAPVSDAEQVQKIQSLPAERCQKDLTQLHFIYGRLRTMSQSDGEAFLKSVAENIRSQGLQLPPPPKPCGTVHLALESRCGDLATAENQCANAGSKQ